MGGNELNVHVPPPRLALFAALLWPFCFRRFFFFPPTPLIAAPAPMAERAGNVIRRLVEVH